MHSDKNKLLMEVNGIPVIDRTLSAFKRFADDYSVDLHCILVVSPGKVDEWKSYISDKDYASVIGRITEGGDIRTRSVGKGVFALSDPGEGVPEPEGDDPVFIHDAARCLIDPDSLKRCLDTITEEGTDVCVSGVNTKNTIKVVRSGTDIVEYTPDRNYLFEVQTPQCFKYSVLKDCYGKAIAYNFVATDDTAVAEEFGYKVRIVEGSYSNIKITTPEDIAFAEAILNSMQ